MDYTTVLEHILGIIFLVIGASVVLNYKNISAAIEEITKNLGLLWIWGFITIFFGAVFIALNNIWTSGLTLVITILGWLSLVKGAYIIIIPNSAVSFYKKCNKNWVLIMGGVLAVIIGLIFLLK